jgi:NAD+ synthase (glutamine-hydrolysing)
MRIAVAQINTEVGDFVGNIAKIKDAAAEAVAAGATLLVTPELALTSYPPEDLLFRDDFCAQCEAALNELLPLSHTLTLVVGYPRRASSAPGAPRYNSAAVLRGGKIIANYDKQKLPNYRVFDEERYFESATTPVVFEHEGKRIGLTICEDLWFAEPGLACKAHRADLLLSINASPFHLDKLSDRYEVMRERVAETGLPLLYVHRVGGQDELVFDGASFALDTQGAVSFQAPWFAAGTYIVDFANGRVAGQVTPAMSLEESVYRALQLALADYVNKNGFPGVLLGLSGGIDSALVLALAVDALGAQRVHAVMMPSEYTASISVEDSREMIALQGCKYSEIAIRPMFKAFNAALASEFVGRKTDTTEENLQSRIRGVLLMALSNKMGSIVVTTGNKSEMATGYATLYGDMAGGYALLKDINKTLVYKLANWRNSVGRVIPQRVIDRPPSAELRPDQKDQDSLPPYDVLDGILELYMEQDKSPEDVVAAGYPEAAVRQVVRLIAINEYKRRQAPVGAKVTHRAFGKDWRYPITSKFRP